MPEAAQTALEQTFSDLANARLRDKSPALLDYLVGFQLVKSNEDGSKAVGIFGFEIGDGWHYAPVFFMNGEIKGLDALYSVDSDLFVPLTEDWVNQIINRRPNQLGEVDTKSKQERGVRPPNYNKLRQLPPGGGSGGLSIQKTSEAMDAMKKIATEPDLPSLPDAIAAFGPEVAGGFIADLQRLPKLAAAVEKHYSLIDFYVPAKTAAKKDEDVTIISSIAQDGAEKLTDAQKEELITGGTAVVDKRPEETKSIVYRTKVQEVLQTPTSGGLYDLLMADGSIAECLVLRISGTRPEDADQVLVYEPDSGRHGMVATKHLFALRQHEPSAFRKVLDDESVAPDKVRPNDCVVFCNQTGDATLGFEIDSAETGVNEIKSLKVKGSYWLARDCSGPYHWSAAVNGPAPWRYGTPDQRVREVVVTEAGSGQIRYLAEKLVVNERRFRAIVLNRLSGDEGWSYKTPMSEARLGREDFGDHNTIRVELEKNASPIKVWKNHDEVGIRDLDGSDSYSKVAALKHLMVRHGLSAHDAKIIIKEAGEATEYRIKYAADLLPFPEVPDSTEGGFMSDHHETKFPSYGVERQPSEDNRAFYQYHSPFGGAEDGEDGDSQSTSQAVQRASQTGQKDVFDASVLGALVKTHNPTDMVERFLPTIVSGMDRLGRLLFLLHWHYDEFQERYGKDDLVDFTDDLKSTFEALGELVLFMKKRTLAGDPEFYGLGLNATMQG